MFSKSIATKGGDVFRDEFSVAFDGSNDYVDCGSDSSLDVGTNDFSVSAWCKVSTKGGSDYHDIVAKGNTLASGDGWGIALVESNKTIYLDTNGDVGRQNAISPTSSWEFGKWYHIVGTRSNSANTLKLYLNGVLVATNASATNDDLGDASINFKIGTSESGRETKGNISEVAYYNSVLTINQVKTIYNGREPYNHKEGVASGNLQAWYRMGDGILDHRQANGLIADQTDATLGSELITGFTNGDTYPFDTLTTSGRDISSAIETSGNWGGCVSNQLNITVGEVYKCTFNLTYNSGDDTVRFVLASGASGGDTARSTVRYSNTNGINTMYFLVTATDSTSYFQIGTWHETDEINFSATNISLKKVGGNSGIMVNMDAVDFTGDTP